MQQAHSNQLNRERKPKNAAEERYLRAAAASKVPVSVHFLDGEVWQFAIIKEVLIFTLIVSVHGQDHLLYKNSLKRIGPARRVG